MAARLPRSGHERVVWNLSPDKAEPLRALGATVVKLGLALEDMRLVLEAARRAGSRLRVAPAATEWWAQAADAGLEALDYSAVIAHLRGAPAREG